MQVLASDWKYGARIQLFWETEKYPGDICFHSNSYFTHCFAVKIRKMQASYKISKINKIYIMNRITAGSDVQSKLAAQKALHGEHEFFSKVFPKGPETAHKTGIKY